MQLSVCAPLNADAWDAPMLETASYTFFHCMAWARVLIESYGFKPRYIMGRDGSDMAALPLMAVQTLMSGRKHICLPFSDSCGPVFTSRHALEKLIGALLQTAGEKGWKALEIREDCGIKEFDVQQRYYEHTIPLNDDPAGILKSFRPSTRRNIQHAEREGVRVTLEKTEEAVGSYYRLHCITRKRHGIPPQPRKFFEAIQSNVIGQGNGFIARARFSGRTIAAVMFLHFGKKAVMKFAASLPDPRHLRPSNLAMWEAIRWYAQNGFESLSLGRTDIGDSGLMQFKNGWCGAPRELSYCRWPPRKHSFTGATTARSLASSAMRNLPVPALRFLGTLLYRYSA